MSTRTLIFLFFLISAIPLQAENVVRGVVLVGPKLVEYGAVRFSRGAYTPLGHNSYRSGVWEDLNASPNLNISYYRLQRVCASVRRAIEGLKREDATQIKVFLAPLFSKVRNSKALLEDLKIFKVPVKILSEENYQYALSQGYQLRTSHEGPAVVWDFEFDGVRIQDRSGSSGLIGKLGVGPARVHVATGNQKSWSWSPNPLPPEAANKAVEYFQSVLNKNAFAKKVDLRGTVFGTGLEFERLTDYAGKDDDVVTLEEIKEVLKTSLDRPDRKIPLIDSENDVIRLLVVKSIMEKKGISKVKVISKAFVRGLLLGNQFWTAVK